MNKITYNAVFENKRGEKINMQFDATNIEDATIEASNLADEKNWEFLYIDPLN